MSLPQAIRRASPQKQDGLIQKLRRQLEENFNEENLINVQGIAYVLEQLYREQGNNDEAKAMKNIQKNAHSELHQEQPRRRHAAAGSGGGGGEDEDAPLDIVPIETRVDFDKLFGVKREKGEIYLNFILPLRYKKILRSSSALLMYGPPGTGKTKIASAIGNLMRRALDTEKIFLVQATASDLKSKWVGQTEKRLRKYFEGCQELAEKEDETARTILFMDEFEALAGSRKEAHSQTEATTVTSLLTLLDGVQDYDRVVFVAATNLPWKLDSAIFRRMKTKLFVDVPGFEARRDMIKQKIFERTGIPRKVYEKKNFENKVKGLPEMLETLTRRSGYRKDEHEKKDAEKRLLSLGPGSRKLKEFMRAGRHLPSGNAATTFGFSFGDLDTVMNNALNKVVLLYMKNKQRKIPGRTEACWILDTKEPECKLTEKERESLPMDLHHLVRYQDVVIEEFKHFKSSVEEDEYEQLVYYHLTNRKPRKSHLQ